MNSFRIHPRLLRCAAALLTIMIVPACMSGGTSGTGAMWNSQSGTGATSGSGDGGLLWNDPNTGTTGGGSTANDLTFNEADPAQWPTTNADANHPVLTEVAQDATQESTIEAYAAAYHSSLVTVNQNQGVVTTIPAYYTGSTKLRSVIRGLCKHLSIHTPDEGVTLDWRMDKAGVNTGRMNPLESTASGSSMTAAEAWNSMAPGVQSWIQSQTNPGWCGGGYWSASGTNYYGLLMIELTTGQSP